MRGHDIDDLFDAARAQPPLDAGPLMAKVFADALDHLPHPKPVTVSRHKAPGFWANVVATLGGKGGLAGLGTAAAFGVFLGFVQPTSLMNLTDSLLAQSPVGELDLIPGVDAILTEG